jgi:hypothetical protein
VEPVDQCGLLARRKVRMNKIGDQEHFFRAGTDGKVATERTALATSQGTRIGRRMLGRDGFRRVVILTECTKKIIRLFCGTNGLNQFRVRDHRIKPPNAPLLAEGVSSHNRQSFPFALGVKRN